MKAKWVITSLLILLALLMVAVITALAAPGHFIAAWGWGVDTGSPIAGYEVCTSASGPCFGGYPGAGIGQFNKPAGVALDGAGNVYVVEVDNHRIQQFDSSGNFIRAWGWGVDTGLPTAGFEICTPASAPCFAGARGGGAGQLNGPYGVAVDNSGNIYVAEWYNHRIQQFDINANFVRAWGWDVDSVIAGTGFEVCTIPSNCKAGIPGGGAGQFTSPIDVAVDISGNIYTADTQNNRIQQFNSSANFVRTWGWGVDTGLLTSTFEVCTPASQPCYAGNPGGGAGQFNFPYALGINNAGNIFVASFYNHRVQQFDSSANFLRTWGWGVDSGLSTAGFEVCTPATLPCYVGDHGSGAGQFAGPSALAIDLAGNIFVSSFPNYRIQQFDSNANFVRTWGWDVDTSGGSGFEICTVPANCQTGQIGSGAGQLGGTFGIATDNAQKLYVAGYRNPRLQIFEYGYTSGADGSWHTPSTWGANLVPNSHAAVTISAGTTITVDSDATCSSLVIEPGATLIIPAGVTLSVEDSVDNHGTLQQTQYLGSSSTVQFLRLQPLGGGADLYRGLDITTDGSTSLGNTLVQIMGNTSQCNTTPTDDGSYRDRCFMANPANSGTVSITLYSTAVEDDIVEDAFFQHTTGTTWAEGAACSDPVGAGGICTGTATFASPAYFLIGSSNDNPSAVQIHNFSARHSSNVVLASALGGLGIVFVGLFLLFRRRIT